MIAVLTPLHGHAAYIGAMLDSLLAQTCYTWECCVVLDGPDADAAAIVREYTERDPRITLVTFGTRRGVAAARNEAVRQTRGAWLLPFDADDVMAPNYLETLFSAVLEPGAGYPPYPIAYAAATCAYPDGQRTVFRYPPFNPATFTARFQIPNATLHPRALWDALGGWDETWTDGAEDWHYWTRAVARGWLQPHNVPAPLWTYREHDGARHSRVGRTYWPQHKTRLDAILQGAA